jgi:S-formylglutathione hydrolase FrmB
MEAFGVSLRRFIAAVATIAALAGVSAAPASAASPVVDFHDGSGIHVLGSQALDSRLLALTVTTPAIASPLNVRVLLPADYASHPHARYPVLYLLHGTSGRASDWTTAGDAEQTTAGDELIVVMPDIAINGNGGGWCTNWWNNGARGQPEWETFHIDELVPWIDANLRTVRSRSGRAIAGLSQGGFCSISYAARHPDLFGTALSYSGAPDIAYDAQAQALVTPVINATETGLDGVPPNSMFGPRQTEEINWAAHDPTTLAANLAHTNLFLYTGNGQPGPLDGGAPNPGAMAIEWGVHQLTQLFHDRLQALGIPSLYDDYGPGTHSWPYWARDLRDSIGPLMTDFAHPKRAPRTFTYMSADPQYSVYGWRVSVKRQVAEFSTLDGSRSGFTLQGSGTATVSTPARYRRHARYAVTIVSGAGRKTMALRPKRRRLVITVPLGPSNTIQEYPLDGPSTATKVYTTRVTIGRAHVRPKHGHRLGSGRRRSR